MDDIIKSLMPPPPVDLKSVIIITGQPVLAGMGDPGGITRQLSAFSGVATLRRVTGNKHMGGLRP
jgi:hypothetical protein